MLDQTRNVSGNYLSHPFTLFVLLLLVAVHGVSVGQAVSWVGGSGLWGEPVNWSSGSVPSGSSDVTVALSPGEVLTVLSDARARTLNLSGSLVIETDASLSVSGAANMQGTWVHRGAFSGGADTVISSGLAWESGSLGGNGIRLTGDVEKTGAEDSIVVSSVILGGTFAHRGSGALAVNGSGRLTIAEGAVYTFFAPSMLKNSGAGGGAYPVVDNFGTVARTGSDGTAEISSIFNNMDGVIEASQGTLLISGGGTSTDGSYNATGDGIIDLSPASNHTYAGTITGVGDGRVIFSSGRINLAADAILNFPSGLFEMRGGLFSANFTNAGVLSLTGDEQKVLGGVLVNEGTIHLYGKGDFALNGSARMENAANGKFILHDDGGVTASGQGGGAYPIFRNSGLLQKAGGTGTSLVDVYYFDHLEDTVDVQTGTVAITSRGTSTGAIFNVAADAVLDLSPANDHNYTGIYTGEGEGQIVLNSGEVYFSSESQLDFPRDYFVMTGGLLRGPVTNTGHVTFSGPDQKRLGSVFTNDGTLHLRGGGSIGLDGSSTLNNSDTGQILIYNGEGIVSSGFGGGAHPVVNNAGVVRKLDSDAASLISVYYFNHLGGTVDVQIGSVAITSKGTSTGAILNAGAGATLNISPDSDHRYSGLYTGGGGGQVVLNSGNVYFSSNSQLDFPLGYFVMTGGYLGGPVTNTGHVTFSGSGEKRLGNVFTNDGILHLRDEGSIGLDGSSTLNNSDTGQILIYNGGGIISSGQGGGAHPVVNNMGIVRKRDSDAASLISVYYFNHLSGTVDVQIGSVAITSKGTSTGAIFNAGAGATLNISPDSDHRYTGLYTGGGEGQVVLNSGAVHFLMDSQLDFPQDYFVMTGGYLRGPVTNIGDITFSGSGLKRLGNVFVNDGTLHLRDGGNIGLDGSSTLNNSDIGQFLIYNGGGIVSSGQGGGAHPVVNNMGILRKRDSDVASLISVYYFNHLGGTVDVQGETLAISSKGNSTSANFMVGDGTILDLSPASDHHYEEGLFRGTGGGTIVVQSGSIKGAGFATFFDFDPEIFQWSGGILGNLTNRNEMTVLPSDSSTRVSGLFTNDGDIFITDGANLAFDGSSRLVNRQLVEMRGEAPAVTRSGFGGGYAPYVLNQNFLRRTGGDGEALFEAGLKLPYSTLSIEQGTLTMSGGGEWTSPNFFIAEGSEAALTGGTFNLKKKLKTTGTGKVFLDGGYLVGDNAVIDFDEGIFTMRSGRLTGSPGLANEGDITLTGDDPKSFHGNVYNAGTIQSDGNGNLAFGNFFNQETGVFVMGGNPESASGNLMENRGIFTKTGTGETTFSFSALDQFGTLEAAAGNLILLSIGSDYYQRNTIMGARYVASGGILTFPEYVHTNNATLEWDGATSEITGIDALRYNNGSIVLRDNAEATLPLALINSGILNVDETSTLDIQSGFTAQASSAIILGISGNVGSGNFGRITAGGPAVLDGLIKLVPTPDFSPQDNDRFPLITYSSFTGEFANLVGFESSPDLIVAPLYEPTEFVLVAEDDAADMAPLFVNLPEVLVPGEPTTISYNLANNGTAPAEAPWRDSLYLSIDDQFDIEDILLARVDQESDLPNGTARPMNVTVYIPGIAPGNYYLIVIADSRKEVLDFDRPSNTAVSATTIPLVWKQLILGEFTSDTLEPGQSEFYQLQAPALSPLRVQLNTLAEEGVVKAFLRANEPATPWMFDGAGEEDSPDQDFSTPFFDDVYTNAGIDLERSSETGERFLQIQPESLPGGTTDFDLLVDQEVFRLIDSQPKVADNASSVTLKVAGMQLPANTKLTLTNGSDSVVGTGFFRASSEDVYATFDLRGLPPGQYRLEARAVTTELIIDEEAEPDPIFVITEEESTSALIDALAVVETKKTNFIANVSTTSRVRAGRSMDVIISYENAGTGNLDAPVLVLYSDPPLSLGNITDGTPAEPSPLQLLAIGSGGPAGILRPGDSGRIHLRGRAPITEGPLQLRLFELYDDGSNTTFRSFLNSIALNDNSTSSTLAQERLVAELGEQWRDYAAQLASQATELSARGRRTHAVSELLTNVTLTIFEPTSFPPPLDPDAPIDDDPFGLLQKYIVSPEPIQPKIFQEPDCSTLGLARDRLMIETAAIGFRVNLAMDAARHLEHFLGMGTGLPPDCSQVHDISYGPDSDIAQQIRDWTEAGVSFADVNNQYKTAVRDRMGKILPNITAGMTETTSFTMPPFKGEGLGGGIEPARLSFYEKNSGGTFTPSTLNATAFNLQAGFGGMQSAEGVIRDLEVNVEIVGDCKIATYSGIIEYTWTDAYEFDADDITKGTFDRAAACLALNGWACNYATSVTMQEAFSGRVVLEGDGENCDGSAPGDDDDDEDDPPSDDPPDEDNPPDDPDDDVPVENPPNDTEDTDIVRSTDPNDILGPNGVTDLNFVRATRTQDYIIRFENIATASAAAQEVFVDLPLDEDFDLSTFELVGYGFSGRDFQIANGPSMFSNRVLLDPDDPESLVVDLDARLDLDGNIAHWTFTTLDSKTGDYPADPFAGFLPPNSAPPIGEGYVAFRVRPRLGAPTGTRIDAQANIIFDLNEPILTPAYFNTLDGEAPEAYFINNSGAVKGPDVKIEWDADDGEGSGAATFDVYVSEDGGPLNPWLSETPQTSATFTGKIDSVYRFAVVARDRVGYKQSPPVDTTLTLELLESLDTTGWMAY